LRMCLRMCVRHQALGERVAELGAVNLLGGDTEVNWPILVAFASVTLLFLLVVGVSKLTGREDAVADARRVYLRLGVLARPQVIGSAEQEAVIRGLFSGRQVAVLLALETVVMNPFLGVFFSWGHEAIVFTQADKAVNLCVVAAVSAATEEGEEQQAVVLVVILVVESW
jgi:hypothetical protein